MISGIGEVRGGKQVGREMIGYTFFLRSHQGPARIREAIIEKADR